MHKNLRRLAGHPAVLCYAVGNEIPASVVRWYGKARVERFIGRLCAAVKSEDPGALVTYVNFPTTEYLDLPFLDFVAFNVYLETKDQLNSYLARLQILADERPLVMTELGLDSRRNGEARQAESLDWQIATAFESGCVGSFVFAWTDEWFRGGNDITDWDFGLTTRDRQPKQALSCVSTRFANVPFCADRRWPRISVAVCSYNGGRTIGETLAALEDLDYPDYEVIVVDDGSTDGTIAVAESWRDRFTQLRVLPNGMNRGKGYSVRHGSMVARGAIILFTDADLSAPIEEAERLFAALEKHDVAIGSRAVDRSLIEVHESLFREFAGIVFNRIVRIILLLPFVDTQCGFKAFRRER
jgi:hypothetical protein